MAAANWCCAVASSRLGEATACPKTLIEEDMPQYLIAIHHPDGYDGSLEDEEMGRDIDVLNEEMQAAGARLFAGGLRPVSDARSLREQPDGKVLVTDGRTWRPRST